MFDDFSGAMEAHQREWWDSTKKTPEETAPHLVSFITILSRVGSLGNAHSHMDNNVTRHQLPCYFNAAEMSLAAVSPDVKVTAADL
jgi:hypothetical protein